ncbi:MAG: peptidylprolyl isomerase [Bryobacterales bacterium]|nr:peptidylprolyl isomerase [Bryobacterales bacterium]
MALRVNGELIDDTVILEEERTIRPRLQEAMAQEATPAQIEERVKAWARENLIERTVLRQAALAEPEPIPAEQIEEMFTRVRSESPSQSGCIAPVDDATLRRELEVRFRVDRLMERVTAKVTPPKPKDVSDYYVKHREEFAAPEAVHAAHIVKNVDENTTEEAAREAIEAAQAALAGGRDFAAVADEMSDCPGRGGDLGFFAPGQMVEAFDAVVFALQPGEVSSVFRTEFGFHIARVQARRAAGVRSLQDVKGEIADRLLAQKREKAVEAYLDKLMAGAAVVEEG